MAGLRQQKKYEVTGINQETGVIQISAVGNGDGYKTMTENSLRKNYKLLAISEKKIEVAGPDMDSPLAAEPTPAPANDAQAVEQLAEKTGRATGSRVQLKDGTITAGSKFIVEVYKLTREDSYKADSPIRWLLKPAGRALLNEHETKIVYGEKISK